MRKNILFILLCSFMTVLPLSAQVKFGVEAGVVSSQTPSGDKAENIARISGFSVGVTGDLVLKNNWILMSGLSWIQKGGELHQELFTNMGNTTIYNAVPAFERISSKINTIELPIKIGYAICVNEHLTLVPSIGGYVSYGFNAGTCTMNAFKTNGEKGEFVQVNWKPYDGYSDAQSKWPSQIEKFNHFDAGVNIGIKAVVSEHYTASFNYSHGLTEIQKQLQLKNSTLQLSVGYKF